MHLMRAGVVLVLLFSLMLASGCVCVRVWPPRTAEDCLAYDDSGMGEKHSRSECYSYMALKNSDKTICDDLNSLDRGRCLIQYASGKKDASVCDGIGDAILEGDLSGTYKSKDLCLFGSSTEERNFCPSISSEGLRNKCFSTYSKVGCYNVENLKDRADCFGSVLFNGVILGLEDYYEYQKCDDKINNLVDKGIVYKRDYSNPRDYDDLPLDQCVVAKAIITENPDLCKVLDKAGQGVVDYCFFSVSEYFQTDYCDSLKPSCSYAGTPLMIDRLTIQPNNFGKEYCKAVAGKFKDGGKEKIILMSDTSFCRRPD